MQTCVWVDDRVPEHHQLSILTWVQMSFVGELLTTPGLRVRGIDLDRHRHSHSHQHPQCCHQWNLFGTSIELVVPDKPAEPFRYTCKMDSKRLVQGEGQVRALKEMR